MATRSRTSSTGIVRPASTITSDESGRKPIRRTLIVSFPAVAFPSLNSPRSSLSTRESLPVSVICAPLTGWPSESRTVPSIPPVPTCPSCAASTIGVRQVTSANRVIRCLAPGRMVLGMVPLTSSAERTRAARPPSLGNLSTILPLWTSHATSDFTRAIVPYGRLPRGPGVEHRRWRTRAGPARHSSPRMPRSRATSSPRWDETRERSSTTRVSGAVPVQILAPRTPGHGDAGWHARACGSPSER